MSAAGTAASVTFRRVNGHIIPIKMQGAVKTAVKSSVTPKVKAPQIAPGTPNRFLQAAGMTLAVGSGLLSGLTTYGSTRRILIGQGASLGLDATATAANVAAYAKGSGSTKQKAIGMAKGEAINQALGWGTMGAVMLANPVTRGIAKGWFKKGAVFAGKILGG